jgi:hypothetical protein
MSGALTAIAQSLQKYISPFSLYILVNFTLVSTLLFLVLTPGFIVNVGGISSGRCSKLVPLPNNSTGKCDLVNGVYVPGGSPAVGELGAANLLKLCQAQRKCHRWFTSGYTGPWPIALHTLVFLVLFGGFAYSMVKSI